MVVELPMWVAKQPNKENKMREYQTLAEEIFDDVNRTFAIIDTAFRDVENRHGLRNALPYVSVPSVKSYSRHEDIRTYDDGAKVETYKNGKLHGEVSYHDKKTPSEYWMEGRQVTKETWVASLTEQEDKKIHVIYIDNRPYEVSGKQFKELKAALTSILKIEKK
jgi:hypothetical protein